MNHLNSAIKSCIMCNFSEGLFVNLKNIAITKCFQACKTSYIKLCGIEMT